MDEQENASESARKRHKPAEPEDIEDSNNVEIEHKSSESQSNSTNNNDSGLLATVELGTSLSSTSDVQELSSSALHIGDSGLDVACNVTLDEIAPTTSFAANGSGDAAIMNTSKNQKDGKETTSVNNIQRRTQRSIKSRIHRNRLTCISSSSDNDETSNDGNLVDHQSAPQSGESGPIFARHNTAEEHTSTSEGVSASHIAVNRGTAVDDANTAALESVNNETTETNPNTNRENRRSGLRLNRAVGRNYRNRWAYVSSPSSSSADEATQEVNTAENTARASSPESAELPSNDNDNQSESSDMDISFFESSDSQNVFRPNSFSDSSSDTDSDTDDAINEPMNDSMNDDANADQSEDLEDVLNKPKPTYTWNSTYELMRREHGLTGNGRFSLRNGLSSGFNTRFYSSRHVVERMKLLHCLRKHTGCVNCLNFNRSGELLCTGSDDTRVVIWDWAQNKVKHSYKSGHTENIFQTKFIETGSSSCLDIISASRDGQIRRAVIPSSGGKVTTVGLYKHKGPVHKIVVCPQNPMEIISVGEDGYIRHHDLRKESEASDILKVVKVNNKKMRLFSISHHPFNTEVCVSGCDRFVRVYDKRNMNKTVHEMCPQQLLDTTIPQVTCSVYNSTGTEILSSYSDDHIYLFNNNVYKKGDYLHRYRGHYNHRTIKGVNFFGPNSEYVISGSDCSCIFFWDKNTECILNYMPGDTMGVVNCLEPHPSIPILATSGLDHNIKIWAPNSEIYPPDMSKLGDRIKRNLRRSVIEESNDIDGRQFHYFMRQFMRPNRARNLSNAPPSQNVPESQTSTSSSEDDYPQLEGIHCRTQ